MNEPPDAGPSREYRLRRGEPTGSEVRRVVLGRLEHAVEVLRDPDTDPVEAVHEARKDMKKLRSALRLVRPALGDKEYGRRTAHPRDAARRISGVRDAQVRSETIDGLAERFAGDPPPGGWDAVRTAVVDGAEPDPGEIRARRERMASEIEAGRDGLAGLSLPQKGAKLFEPGLRRAYEQGRKRFRKASRDPTDDRLHDWRKRAKDLWYHLRLVGPAWEEVLDPLADQADELSDLLGDDHDLAVLGADLSAAPLGGEQREHLARLIATRRGELQIQAFALGERIYAERPKSYARRIAAYWKARRF